MTLAAAADHKIIAERGFRMKCPEYAREQASSWNPVVAFDERYIFEFPSEYV
jgi:hypothetical protein